MWEFTKKHKASIALSLQQSYANFPHLAKIWNYIR